MSSDNPSGADNQQERLAGSVWLDRIPSDLGHFIAGFVEGEGSFNVPIVRERDRGLPFRVTLSFNVSQVGPEMPELLKATLGVGRTRGRRDGVFYYEVTRSDHLEQRIFPFFEIRASRPKGEGARDFPEDYDAGPVRSSPHRGWHRRDSASSSADEPRREETTQR